MSWKHSLVPSLVCRGHNEQVLCLAFRDGGLRANICTKMECPAACGYAMVNLQHVRVHLHPENVFRCCGPSVTTLCLVSVKYLFYKGLNPADQEGFCGKNCSCAISLLINFSIKWHKTQM